MVEGLEHVLREEREELGRIEREVGDEAVAGVAVVLERVRNCSRGSNLKDAEFGYAESIKKTVLSEAYLGS